MNGVAMGALPVDGAVHDIAFSPNGQLLAVGTEGGGRCSRGRAAA